MKDSVIFEALKVAILRAFFVAQPVMDAQGNQVYTGGQISEVVRQIMESSEMKKLVEKLAEGVLKKKDIIEKKVLKELESYVKERTESLIKCEYSMDSWIKEVMNEIAKPVIEEALQKDQKLKDRIAKQVNIEDYNLDINVSVNITKRERGKK